MTDTWVIPIPTTSTDYQYTKFRQCSSHRTLEIAFFISQSEHICKWGIKYANLVTTDHIDSTCVHHYPHTKFHHCTPYRTLDIWLFLLLANQNRHANEVSNMHIQWRQTMWVVLVPITTHIPSFINVAHTELWLFHFFVISQSELIYANEVLNMCIQWRQTLWAVTQQGR